MKIVINQCHGGFGLSDEAMELYVKESGTTPAGTWDIARDDPTLVRIVEEMGFNSSARYSDLKVVEVPDGVRWFIQEYDGMEWVAEAHRTWR